MKLLEQATPGSDQTRADSEPSQMTTADFVIIDLGNPVAGDVADALSISAGRRIPCVGADSKTLSDACSATTVAIVFTRGGLDRWDDPEVCPVIEQLAAVSVQRLCLVTNCSVHFRAAVAVAQKPLHEAPTRKGLSTAADALLATARHLRTGFVLSPRSPVTKWCRRLSWLAPLLSDSPRSTFVTLDELTDCLRCLATADTATPSQVITLLGTNRPWREILRDSAPHNRLAAVSKPFLTALKFVGVGIFLHTAMHLAERLRPGFRQLNFDTLTPQSEQELLSLCHRHNMRHIEVCGYNNGVNHFGWKHHGKTVVPTADSGTTIEIENDHLLVDAGVTLKKCVTALAAADKQFYVVPNYSYIAMGTIFFVPVHGSGSHVSTLGDTVQWVRFVNPDTGEFLEATREEALFQQTMYNRSSGLVLLQMVLKVRETTRYTVQKTTLTDPSADEVWKVFFDPDTSNIEARKARAASDQLLVSKYYMESDESSDNSAGRLSVPQDTIGSLWDRLEENRFTAWLFHLLVRKLAYHVELFLQEEEFAIFWKHHQSLPVSKIQLRLARRDEMPHSPIGDADRLSADLFMSRRHRDTFQQFITTQLPHVRLNPGKQSL